MLLLRLLRTVGGGRRGRLENDVGIGIVLGIVVSLGLASVIPPALLPNVSALFAATSVDRFNCGAVVEASDFFVSIQVRASESGAPVTDFVKTDVLVALEEAELDIRHCSIALRSGEIVGPSSPGVRSTAADTRASSMS